MTSVSRRSFINTAASSALAASIAPKGLWGKDAPSNRLNIALIGVGGRGASHIKDKSVQAENIVAMCDVDAVRSAAGIKVVSENHTPKIYRDYRKMFDEMDSEIDAVIIATPDHTHYVIAMEAIKRGKHVYCEKPLAHSIYETRMLTNAARKSGVMTQMGNQGRSSEQIRMCREWVQGGAIGEVAEVRTWSDRPAGGYAFPASMGRSKERPQVPDTLDWDLWLGPAQERPYHPSYCPIFWRAWQDFGTGALGDMGCHIIDPSFMALDLGAASTVTVEANVSYNANPEVWNMLFGNTSTFKEGISNYIKAIRKETYPTASIVRFEFPARGKMPPVKLSWHDGGLLPERPEGYASKIGSNGAFLLGDKGGITHGSHGASSLRIFPETKMQQYIRSDSRAPESIRRVEGGQGGHQADWIRSCKDGKPASSHFEYGGALTELVLLGVLAQKIPNTRLVWDRKKMQFDNEAANALVKPTFRKGWTL